MDDDNSPQTNGLEADNISPSSASRTARNPGDGGDQRIQFVPTVRPDHRSPVSRTRDGSVTHRRQSVASIPPVLTEEEKDRRRRMREEEKKHVDIDEHLMPHTEVAERYKTRINLGKPLESLGLTHQQVEQLLREHGPNQLTPPKRRHPFLKYLDCLSSLFNVLLILAGILEYILLGINYKDNFQNVSPPSNAAPRNSR